MFSAEEFSDISSQCSSFDDNASEPLDDDDDAAIVGVLLEEIDLPKGMEKSEDEALPDAEQASLETEDDAVPEHQAAESEKDKESSESDASVTEAQSKDNPRADAVANDKAQTTDPDLISL